MAEQQQKSAPDDGRPCDDQGSVSFSLETIIGHRKLKISSWKHLRRLLGLRSGTASLRLAYLNTIEKVGCIYCSYANGLLGLITEIAARTE
jgi:hypothetical protein